jgi:hemoglobin-like flavoprotein
MKQTAVEWFEKNISKYISYHYDNAYEEHNEVTKIFEQAKEMERQQMDKVAGDWWNEGASYMHDGRRKYESFEQYYNETFITNEK